MLAVRVFTLRCSAMLSWHCFYFRTITVHFNTPFLRVAELIAPVVVETVWQHLPNRCLLLRHRTFECDYGFFVFLAPVSG